KAPTSSSTDSWNAQGLKNKVQQLEGIARADNIDVKMVPKATGYQGFCQHWTPGEYRGSAIFIKRNLLVIEITQPVYCGKEVHVLA
ncbi:hypothetical protein SK128_001174, partial [Halocaridina rubra]